jgi:hypothetical protein
MKKIPMSDGEDPNLNGKMELAMKTIQGSTAYSNNRNRPYNGQPHTQNGKRGQTKIQGLTMRDLADCITQGFLKASLDEGLSDKTKEINDEFKNTKYASLNNWRHDDIYKIECDFDPGAVIQCVLCFVEDMMGIFPNVEHISYDEILKDSEEL